MLSVILRKLFGMRLGVVHLQSNTHAKSSASRQYYITKLKFSGCLFHVMITDRELSRMANTARNNPSDLPRGRMGRVNYVRNTKRTVSADKSYYMFLVYLEEPVWLAATDYTFKRIVDRVTSNIEDIPTGLFTGSPYRQQAQIQGVLATKHS